MARQFIAELYVNCINCEDIIEPGDLAGYCAPYEGALCADCLTDAVDQIVDEP